MFSTKIKKIDISEVSKGLRNVDDDLVAEVGKAVFVFGDMVRAEAQHSIVEGSISGPGHVPSLPGEPPSADTRVLDQSIVTRRTGLMSVEVVANAPYAAALEYGRLDGSIAERPFMRPALKKRTPEGMALVRRAVNVAIKKNDRRRKRGDR